MVTLSARIYTNDARARGFAIRRKKSKAVHTTLEYLRMAARETTIIPPLRPVIEISRWFLFGRLLSSRVISEVGFINLSRSV